MSLQINKIYKVKEGHEGKCWKYKKYFGKYIKRLLCFLMGHNMYWVTESSIFDTDSNEYSIYRGHCQRCEIVKTEIV